MEATADYFKIVAVIKKKRIEYSYVPHKWEAKNILKWPQSNLTSLRQDASSAPEEDWKSYPCKVKKTNILGLQEAELWEQEFIDEGTDTDASVRVFDKIKQTKSSNVLVDRSNIYEDMFEENQHENQRTPQEIMPKQKIVLAEIRDTTKITPNSHVQITENNNDFELSISKKTMHEMDSQQKRNNGYASSDSSCFEPESTRMILKLENSVKILSEKIETLNKNYSNLEQWFIKINICLDKILETKKDHQISRNKEIKETESFLTKLQFPLSTTQDLISLEKELDNKAFYKQMVDFMTSFCGKSGEEEGTKVGYRIIDKIISPILLTEYSWTGISKNKDNANVKKKSAFQLYENFIVAFQEAITAADSRWNRQKTVNFFKDGILKHSKKRSQRKGAMSKIQINEKEPNEEIPREILNEENQNLEEIEQINPNDIEVFDTEGNVVAFMTPDDDSYFEKVTKPSNSTSN